MIFANRWKIDRAFAREQCFNWVPMLKDGRPALVQLHRNQIAPPTVHPGGSDPAPRRIRQRRVLIRTQNGRFPSGRVRLYRRFVELAAAIHVELDCEAVLDGEIVCLGAEGRPQFFRKSGPEADRLAEPCHHDAPYRLRRDATFNDEYFRWQSSVRGDRRGSSARVRPVWRR
jgi:hypothetical protein